MMGIVPERDIVDRLRSAPRRGATCNEAADEIERLRAALEPVRTIYCPPPDSASRTDDFGKSGCPLTPADIRAMQEAIGIVYKTR